MDDIVITLEKSSLEENAKSMGNMLTNSQISTTSSDSFVDVEEKPPISITGIIYDEEMTEYFCESENHVERPARITSIYQQLKKDGLLERCKLLESRKATKDEILLKHTEKHFDDIMKVEDLSDNELKELEGFYDSIYFHKNVTKCSLLSAGCTLEIMENVINGSISNGAAVVRPPGHHALEHCSMGFCHFNNVAIAAMLAITKYNLKRILIVDWDVHYGNGIHKMFENDCRILYFSLHRYDNKMFWPCLEEGNYTAIGCGEGEGYNMHVAWNRSRMGDSEYKCAFENLLIPVANEFNPELVLVSAGFDSGLNDPLGRCCLSPAGYSYMTKELMNFANGKVVIVLEGGYNLRTISKSMSACVSTLLGDDPPLLGVLEKPFDSAIQSILNTRSAVKEYWECLQTPCELELNDSNCKNENKELSSSSSSEGINSEDLIKE